MKERGIPITKIEHISHTAHAKNIRTIKDFFHHVRSNPMTVDGLILENLIREIISTEFEAFSKTQNKNSDQIERLKQQARIESSKQLDTATRLKRLGDDYLQKQIADRQYNAKKQDIEVMREDNALLREWLEATQAASESTLAESVSEVRALGRRLHQRDAPFFEKFADLMVQHKDQTTKALVRIQEEHQVEAQYAFDKI